MATVTRTFELSKMASRQLDRWVEEEQCDPADVVNSLLLLFGDWCRKSGPFARPCLAG